MQPRYFTVDEVNRLIPRLEELLVELREANRRMLELGHELGPLAAQRSQTNGFHVAQENRAKVLQGEVDEVVARFRELAQQVADLGAELKDPEQGLVDFRARRGGQEVYLCWRLGEPECSWWHDLEAGFAGREPLE